MQEQRQQPSLSLIDGNYLLYGDWTTAYLKQWLDLQPSIAAYSKELKIVTLAMDTNGAMAFLHIFGKQASNWPEGLTPTQQQLLRLVLKEGEESIPEPKSPNWLADLGFRFSQFWGHANQLLNFIGQLFTAFYTLLCNPRQFKPKLLFDVIQRDGLHAVPIIALLAFLLGAVIAWQGGLQLKTYGANVFIVELVALTHLRELGPLITAILVAGRSGSAYAAQLATMNINQEILALRSLGQNPFDWLILPKLLGLIITLPLLTLLADLTGLLGGSLVAHLQLEISPTLFWQRLSQEVSVSHFFIGMIKAPVFAIVIVSVGCMQGMLASGGADAVGERTTRSVVQAIFLVIIIDAVFSVIFSNTGW
ncbi:MlaE family ABC transporter permease [Marinospirillum insulare]|uniref:ABC transporter permease n=1 Tax=Marinospirillum insulare TaxID=217169 RepID=A0ABQ5ZRW9_9GAMM|nr:ABC transporter permease [Marinospirillum insulare]GLR62890.1 ABC transporter permease [Marinospirillum insulare]